MSNSDSRIDLVSGAEVPAEEIEVTQVMVEAWWDLFHRSRIISDSIISMGYCVMERARRAEAAPAFGPEWRKVKMAEALAAAREEGRHEAIEECLRVPEVWSDIERDGMANAFHIADRKHGHYETLFAVVTWLLHHRKEQMK